MIIEVPLTEHTIHTHSFDNQFIEADEETKHTPEEMHYISSEYMGMPKFLMV